MSSFNESEEVAKDFQGALEDLSSNARYEIQNLTVIARENTEHALAISGALQDHIKRVAPHKKLPSLYVLDSIAKNVGTPYTLFFGRKLYSTFMEAYAASDGPTRRKMDEMFKTWKEPVPGSLDHRPVFPPDVVRPIENALLKFRNLSIQQDPRAQQMMARGRPMPAGAPYRNTPTPPGNRPPSQANMQGQPSMQIPNGGPYQPPAVPQQNPYPTQPTPVPQSRLTPQPASGASAYQPPFQGAYGAQQPGISIVALNDDIQQLISATKAESNPYDLSIQTRLKALLDLQSILQTQNLPQEQLVLVKNQIAELAVKVRAPPAQTPTPVSFPQSVAVAPPPPAAPKVTIDSLLGPGALAALMARKSATPQASTPQPPPTTMAIRSPPPQHVEPPKSSTPLPSDPMAVLNMLRKRGMLSGSTPSTQPTPVPVANPLPPPPPPSAFPIPIPGMGPGSSTTASQQMFLVLSRDIVLKPQSLKQFRPQLLPFLFDGLGPQCSQCGRRFKTDEEGKKKKTAHMDWHFRVNQRIADAEKRGQHRSWFVDEMDWIKSREIIDVDHVAPNPELGGPQGQEPSRTRKLQWIPVPDDPVLANSVCPICQEKFETRWLDDAQDFVWTDAIQVGGRIYHASCHREATGDSAANAPYARATPEPLLGKRKAEDELVSARGKMKAEF